MRSVARVSRVIGLLLPAVTLACSDEGGSLHSQARSPHEHTEVPAGGGAAGTESGGSAVSLRSPPVVRRVTPTKERAVPLRRVWAAAREWAAAGSRERAVAVLLPWTSSPSRSARLTTPSPVRTRLSETSTAMVCSTFWSAAPLLRWYEAPSYAPHDVKGSDGYLTSHMQVADMNGDGALDVVSPDDFEVYWFENPLGQGGKLSDTWPRHLVGDHGQLVHELWVVDLDLDGKLDVVGNPSLEVWIQGKDADTFTSVDLSALAHDQGLAVGFVDQDQRPDLGGQGSVATNPGRPDRRRRVRRACGGRRPLRAPRSTWRISTRTARRISSTRRWRSAPVTSSGTRRARPTDPGRSIRIGGVSYVHDFAVVDIDKKGRPDIVFAEMNPSPTRRVGAFLNHGQDDWSLDVIATTGSHNIVLADLGNDCDPRYRGGRTGKRHRSRSGKTSRHPPEARARPEPSPSAAVSCLTTGVRAAFRRRSAAVPFAARLSSDVAAPSGAYRALPAFTLEGSSAGPVGLSADLVAGPLEILLASTDARAEQTRAHQVPIGAGFTGLRLLLFAARRARGQRAARASGVAARFPRCRRSSRRSPRCRRWSRRDRGRRPCCRNRQRARRPMCREDDRKGRATHLSFLHFTGGTTPDSQPNRRFSREPGSFWMRSQVSAQSTIWSSMTCQPSVHSPFSSGFTSCD